MALVRYDGIRFLNGQVLEIPVFSSNTERIPFLGEYYIDCKCVVFAAAGDQMQGHSYSLGLPVGVENAWEDAAGYLWYLERRDDDENNIGVYYPHLGYLGRLTARFAGYVREYVGQRFGRKIGGIWAYRVNGENKIRFQQFNNDWGSMILGKGNYLRNNNEDSQISYDDWYMKAVQDGTSTARWIYDAYEFPSLNFDGGSGFGWYRCQNGYTNLSNVLGSAWELPISSIPDYQEGQEPTPYDTEPNKAGGYSKKGGGGGTFDRSSDTISVPTLPTLNATDAGFVTLYKPNLNTMIELAKRLWSPNVIDLVSQLFGDPMDLVIGLGIVPVNAPATRTSSPSIGPIVIPLVIPVYDSQYYQHDCGSIEVREFWGSAFDYAPYTKISIYLPYVGVRELDTDEVMGHTVGVKYHVDLFGGAIMAFVTVDGSVRYQFAGNCMQQIPVGKADYNQLVQNLINIACVVGAGIASSGASAAASVAAAETSEAAAGAGMTLGAANAGTAFQGEIMGMSTMANWNGDHGKQLSACTMDAVMTSKPRVERTGSLSATTGQLGVQTPYLIISRAEQCLPTNYKRYRGYPSNITARLGDLSGYTEVESIRLNDLAATQPEIVEIYDMLKKGVII